MKFKKVVAAALTAVMAASMLTGCGSGASKTVKSEDGRVVVKLTRACFNLGAVDTAQVKKVQDKINAYLKDKGANVYVEITELGSGDYADKVNLSLSNKEINLLWTASWESVIGTNDLVPKKAVKDITELVKDTPLYKSMDAGQWEATKYDGKIYYIPVYKDNVEGYDVIAPKRLVDKYNWDLSSIKTIADIEPMLADAKKEGLQYPYLTQRTAMFYRYNIDKYDFFTADATSNFFAVDRAKNEVVDTILTDDYKEFCKLMSKWREAGYISNDDVTKKTTDTTSHTQEWGFTWWTDIPVNAEANTRLEQDVEVATVTKRWAHSTSALGSCYCITSNTNDETAKAAIEFMGLLYTDNTLADIYTFGIEGEDFEYTADKRVTVFPDKMKYNHGMWESASATVVSPADNEPLDKANLYKAFNGGAETSCAAGFRFDKSKVSAEYAACIALFEEYGFPLENGGVALADVDATIEKYQKALDEAGYQKCLEEFKKQYNDWKK